MKGSDPPVFSECWHKTMLHSLERWCETKRTTMRADQRQSPPYSNSWMWAGKLKSTFKAYFTLQSKGYLLSREFSCKFVTSTWCNNRPLWETCNWVLTTTLSQEQFPPRWTWFSLGLHIRLFPGGSCLFARVFCIRCLISRAAKTTLKLFVSLPGLGSEQRRTWPWGILINRNALHV